MKRYVTFGQAHVHSINGKTFDKDCVAVLEGTRDDVFNTFGQQFCWEYDETEFDFDSLNEFYPRGLINV